MNIARQLSKAGLKTPLHRADWTTGRLKFLFKKKTRPVQEADEVVTAFRDGVVTRRANRREDGFTFAEKEIGYQGIEPCDLAIHAMDGFAGAIGISDSRGKVSPVLSVLVPQSRAPAEPRFWAYYLRNLAVTGFIESLAKGIRERSTDFRWKDASNLLVNYPDLPIQKAITDFLDRETARIDQLIEKKQRMVEVLGERETNTTRRLLSEGLNPNAARTSSKAHYLPRVPEHWQVLQLRLLVRIWTGSRDTKDRVDDGSFPFYVRSMRPERINSYCFEGEAVLTSGDGAGVGKVFHHVDEKFALHQRMYAFTDFRRLSGQYFYEFLRCFFAEQMTQWSAKSTVDSVRLPFLKTMLFAIPPRDEQSAILGAIAQRKARDDQISIKTLTSIDRLREFRSALITAVVTGQIDASTWGKQGTTDRRLDRIEEASSP